MNDFKAEQTVYTYVDGIMKPAVITGFDDMEGRYIVTFNDGTKGAFYESDLLPYNSNFKQIPKMKNGEVVVVDKVINDLKGRSELGLKKYGHLLETFNGRSSIQDAYEESLDQSMYLKQRILEIKILKEKLGTVIDNAIENNNVLSTEDMLNLHSIYTNIDGE
jgi:hypothetical protein